MHPSQCSFVELRQYTLVPGTRESFVELFEREFVDTQEAAGMRLLGTFADLDDPDRFVWLRGFADLTTRVPSLSAFYFGPCWKAHRDEANAMMIDSDNVHLLQPVPGYRRLEDVDAAAPRAEQTTIVVQPVGERTSDEQPPLTAAGLLGVLATARVANDFPRLPVIENESVLVAVLAGARPADDVRQLAHELAVVAGCEPDGGATVLRLAPTPRSRL